MGRKKKQAAGPPLRQKILDPKVLAAVVTGVFALAVAILSKQPLPEPTVHPITLTPASLLLTATSSSTPSPIMPPTSTVTRTPAFVARVTNISAGAQVAQNVDVMGEYTSALGQDELWIFTQNPDDRYYAQSLFLRGDTDDCQVRGTLQKDGKWEIPVVLGGDNDVGSTFDIVVTRAGPTASAKLGGQQRANCLNQSFVGERTLPRDLTEIERIRVTRSAALINDPPHLSGPSLPGQVALTNLPADSKVSQAMTLVGTSNGLRTNTFVWVLVYPYFVRWYPQSTNPCRRVGAEAGADGSWKVHANFGGPGEEGRAFYISLVIADEDANRSLTDQQQRFCEAQYYPGLLTLELPNGMMEAARYKVVRK